MILFLEKICKTTKCDYLCGCNHCQTESCATSSCYKRKKRDANAGKSWEKVLQSLYHDSKANKTIGFTRAPSKVAGSNDINGTLHHGRYYPRGHSQNTWPVAHRVRGVIQNIIKKILAGVNISQKN